MTTPGWHPVTGLLNCACGEASLDWPATGATITCKTCGRRYRTRVVLELLSVECPCCGWTGERFGSEVGESNLRCPQCDAMPRHRFIGAYLSRHTPFLAKPTRVLHFAPEKSIRALLESSPLVRSTTTDLTMRRVDVHTDITRLAFSAGAFDLIIVSHVMEHIPDDLAAYRELLRVLRPGGAALVIIPIYWKLPETYEDFSITHPEQREVHFGQRDHVRKCGLDYGQRMIDAGFIVEPIVSGNIFATNLLHRHGIRERDILFHCAKPA